MVRVTRAEAARQLDVDRATVTRWCKKHPALLDEDGLVSVDDLREHRDQVIDPALQTKKKFASTPAKALPKADPSLNDHRSRKERAAAEGAELDLAERLGQTLRRDEVEAAVTDAAELLRQKAAQMVRDRAEALAAIDDVRAMERALDEMMRDLLTAGARALAEAARGESPADAA